MERIRPHISRGERTRNLLVLSILLLSTLPIGLSSIISIPFFSTSAEALGEELEGRAPTDVELTPGVEAAFTRESYAPRSRADLVIYNRAKGLKLQIFRSGPEGTPTRDQVTMNGLPVTKPVAIGTSSGRKTMSVTIGKWPTGVYFARLSAADGRLGFAPFVLRPRRLGQHRVAVVMPTLTWQAYNLRDMDGDGTGDSWYASWRHKTVQLGRPYLNRGVPSRFRQYDLPFLHWLSWTHRGVDYLAQADLEAAESGAALAKAYDLIVFPGHHEYVTTREYDVVEAYRDLGGNLMFLSANNFFWRVIKSGNLITKTQQWRDLGRPEAALIGVQYRGNDNGTHRGTWHIRGASAVEWIFSGTGLEAGDTWGNGSIEIDRKAPQSPRGTQVLAEIPNLFGPGFTAQMTYYETPRGAKVYAAGAFTVAGAVLRADVRPVVENLWERLTRP